MVQNWEFGKIVVHEKPWQVSTFPWKNEVLLRRWMKFVNRRDWEPKRTSILCEKYFDEEFISRGKRCTLKWSMDPVPTKHSFVAIKRPFTLTEMSTPRKPPKIRYIEPDQLPDFLEKNKIESFAKIDQLKHCPPGYSSVRNETSIIFHVMAADDPGFPFVSRCIMIDNEINDLHVNLEFNGRMLPFQLPQ